MNSSCCFFVPCGDLLIQVDLAKTCEQLRYDYMTFDRCKTYAFGKKCRSTQDAKLPRQWGQVFFTFDRRCISYHLQSLPFGLESGGRRGYADGAQADEATWTSTDASCHFLPLDVCLNVDGSIVQIGCVRRLDQAPCGGKWHAGHCSALILEFLIIEIEPKEHRHLNGCTVARGCTLSEPQSIHPLRLSWMNRDSDGTDFEVGLWLQDYSLSHSWWICIF